MNNAGEISNKINGIEINNTKDTYKIIPPFYKGKERLKGKTALITGGDNGMGRSIALHFAREGADIAIIYSEIGVEAIETKRLIEKEKSKCLLIEGDYSCPDFCYSLKKKFLKNFPKINILVNNTAIRMSKKSNAKTSIENFKNTCEIYPYLNITKALLEILDEGDCIINTTAITAYRNQEFTVDYSNNKCGILNFTQSLAKVLQTRKIRVNCVSSFSFWKPQSSSPFELSTLSKDIAPDRVASPSEIAPAFIYLASEESNLLTGHIIPVIGEHIICA